MSYTKDDGLELRPMEAEPDQHWPDLLFFCDEYQDLANAGESDPGRDQQLFGPMG